MRKLNTFDELINIIGENELKKLCKIFSSLNADFRDEKLEKLLGGQFIAETEVEFFMINNIKMIALKPPGEKPYFIPV